MKRGCSVVVGNGVQLVGLRLGHKIDAYDTIVRCKHPRLDDDYGHRVDFIVSPTMPGTRIAAEYWVTGCREGRIVAPGPPPCRASTGLQAIVRTINELQPVELTLLAMEGLRDGVPYCTALWSTKRPRTAPVPHDLRWEREYVRQLCQERGIKLRGLKDL